MDTKDVQNPTIVGITEDNNESIGKPSTTISCTDEKWLLIATGSLSPEYAYMRGFMKIDGSMGNALKVKTLLALLTKEK